MSSAKSKMVFNRLVLLPVRLFSRSSILRAKDKTQLNLNDNLTVPVEKDVNKLATYVCGTNLFVEGGEDIKLKPDSEYPDWLWKIGPPLPLEQLDRNTKAYWERVAQIREKQLEIIKSLTKTSTVHK